MDAADGHQYNDSVDMVSEEQAEFLRSCIDTYEHGDSISFERAPL
jgi:hypothetical protein